MVSRQDWYWLPRTFVVLRATRGAIPALAPLSWFDRLLVLATLTHASGVPAPRLRLRASA